MCVFVQGVTVITSETISSYLINLIQDSPSLLLLLILLHRCTSDSLSPSLLINPHEVLVDVNMNSQPQDNRTIRGWKKKRDSPK